MTTVNHLKILLLIIGCLLSCNSIYCSEQSKAITTPTETTVEKSTATNDSIREKTVSEWLKDHIKYIKEDHRNNDKDERRNRNDAEHNNNGQNNNGSQNNNGGENNSVGGNNYDRGQRKYDPSQTKSTASSTIVTTIIVVTTETPTNIYTGNVNPAQQKGSSDTNPATTNNDRPSPSEAAKKLSEGLNAYRRLVLALSIVGGIAGIALIAGAFIFTRMSRKRKRKQALDLESAHSNISTPSSPKLPPTAHCRTSSIRSEDGEMTIIDFNQDPFQDPLNTPPYYKTSTSSQNGFNMSPSELPAHLESNQYSYRQNQTLSMLSQTTSAALPSAPTAKELDSIKYENPFEEEYGGEHSHQQSDRIVVNEVIPLHNSPMSSPSIKSIPSPQQVPSSQSTERFSPDLLPPPAYTLCATPSAPPLYALPNNRRTLEPQRYEEDSSRRHSISSCSVTSSTRPLSLRRGSGSLAHISSPFS